MLRQGKIAPQHERDPAVHDYGLPMIGPHDIHILSIPHRGRIRCSHPSNLHKGISHHSRHRMVLAIDNGIVVGYVSSAM